MLLLSCGPRQPSWRTPSAATDGDEDKHSQLVELAGRSGDVVAESRIRSTPRTVAAMFSVRPRARVVLDAGGHSGWMSRQLSEAGHEVLVANPRRLKLTHDRKSDRVDAEMLARIGRENPKLLYPVLLRTESMQTALATVRSRDALIKARTQLVNHVRATVKTFGARCPSATRTRSTNG